jgi:hypothetical protein
MYAALRAALNHMMVRRQYVARSATYRPSTLHPQPSTLFF